MQGYGKSELRMFQEVERNQQNICSQEIPSDLGETSAGEMLGAEAGPKWFKSTQIAKINGGRKHAQHLLRYSCEWGRGGG